MAFRCIRNVGIGALVVAGACAPGDGGDAAGLRGLDAEAAGSSTLRPSGDGGRQDVTGVPDDGRLYDDVNDGNAGSYVESKAGAAWTSHTASYTGGPAGTVTSVAVTFSASTRGGQGTAQVVLLDDDKAVAYGDEYTLGSPRSFSRTFTGLNVAGVSHLRTQVRLHNTSGKGSLAYSDITISPTTSGGSPSGEAMPVGDIPGWKQVYADDFKGGTLDPKAWGHAYDGPPGNGYGLWARSHLVVHDGVLELQGYRDPAHGNAFTTAGVAGIGPLSREYGKYLVRYRVDKGKGVWYVALLWPGKGYSWPPEVDFAEEDAGNRDLLTTTLHYGTRAHPRQHPSDRVAVDTTEWHTAGVEWTRGKLVYTLDGETWGENTVDVPSIPMTLDLQTQAPPCAVHKSSCYDSTTPARVDMHIDWVSVYAPAD